MPAQLAVILALVIPAGLLVAAVVNDYREAKRRKRVRSYGMEGF